MAVSKDDILDALRMVMDPDQSKDLVTLQRVGNISVEDQKASFTLVLSDPEGEAAGKIKQDCIDAIKDLVDPDLDIQVSVVSEEEQKKAKAQQESGIANVSNIIAVASGKGGVGKSMVAVNLACALAKTGAKVGLVDTDIYGPSIPTMFGINEKPNINTRRRLIPLEKYGVKLVSMGFLVDSDESVIWRGPMVSSAVKQFLNDVEWGELDYLVMDLPPGTGDIQLTIVQNVPLSGGIIVSTPQDVALNDARKAVAMFNKVKVPVLGVVENMAYFTPPDYPDRKYYIFGQSGAQNLAKKMEIPFLGEVPIEEKTRDSGDKGKPIVVEDESSPVSLAMAQLASTTMSTLADKDHQPAEKVEIKIK